jgi:hypothetical protein
VLIFDVDGLEGSANAVVGSCETPPIGAPFLASVGGFGNVAGCRFVWNAVVVLPDPCLGLLVVLLTGIRETLPFADIRKK